MAVMLVELFTATPVAGTPPTVTVAPLSKSMPVRFATVPPARRARGRRLREHEALGELRCVAVRVGGRGGHELARLEHDGNVGGERRVARTVRRDLDRAQVILSLQVRLREGDAGRGRVEVDVEDGGRDAVQDALDVRRRGLRRDGRDDRKVLAVVRARVGVARVVRRDDTVCAEVDAQGPIAEDTVSTDVRAR